MAWERNGKLQGPEAEDLARKQRDPPDWQQWIMSGTQQPNSWSTHMFLQFSSNAGVNTEEKANAIIDKILAGLNSPS